MISAAIGGRDDHVHILFDPSPKMPLAKAVDLNRMIEYIDNQEEHHSKRGFEVEYFALLRKHGIKFDPQDCLG